MQHATPQKPLRRKKFRRISSILLFISMVFGLTAVPLAFSVPILTATKTDVLLVDNDTDNVADPGDTIRYTVNLLNSGTMDATNVDFTDTIDANTTLVAGSVKTTPIARHDSYAATGNVGISVPAGSGVLVNDNDPDGTTPTLTIVSSPSTSANGGNVAVASDGSFTYNPPAGFEGTDTFSYTVQDSDGNQDPATVSISVSDVIWFIDNSAGGGGDGRLSSPFNNIASFNAIQTGTAPNAKSGDGIFLYTGSGNYTSGITLLNNQFLIGQGATSSIESIIGITLPAHSNALPTTGGTRPVITNAGGSGITLASGNLLRGLNVGNTSTSSGAGINGSSVGTLTILNMSITGQGKAVDISGGTLNVSLDAVTVTSATNGGFRLNSVGGSTTISALNITTTGGTGFLANSAGTVTVTGATNTVSSTSGTAVSLTNTTIGASGITLQSVSSSGADTGITLNNTGTGDFTVTGTGTTDGSGGTLNNLNDHGIELISAQDVSISNMNLTNATTTQDVAPNTATCDNESGGTNTGCNAPVHMVNATNISLTNLTISGSVQHGINGNNVNGLTISNTDLTLIGNQSLENGMQFINLLGTVTFNNLNIDASRTRNVLIENNTGTAVINVTNSTINNAQEEDGFHLVGGNSANVTLNVSDSTFFHNNAPQLKAHAEDSSTVNVTITDNTFDGEPTVVGNTGLDLAVRDNANLTFNVSGTTLGDQVFEEMRGQVINVIAIGGGTASGRINRNDINGSNQGAGIRVVSEVTVNGSAPSVTVEIDGNDIVGVLGGGSLAGIHIESRDGTGGFTGPANVQATINNNNVRIAGAPSAIQAFINGGNTLCLDVTNNDVFDVHTSSFAGFGSTHYIGNPVSGGGGGAGNVTYDGYITGDLGTTWNNNGNTSSAVVAAGNGGEAFVDGTEPTNGTCATVAAIDSPTIVVDATNGNAAIWAFADRLAEMRASYLNTPALAERLGYEITTNDDSSAVIAAASPKPGTAAKPAQSGEIINLPLGLLNPGQAVAITFDVTVDNTIPANVTQVCNQGLFTSGNHADLLTDDPGVGGATDPTCTPAEPLPTPTPTPIPPTPTPTDTPTPVPPTPTPTPTDTPTPVPPTPTPTDTPTPVPPTPTPTPTDTPTPVPPTPTPTPTDTPTPVPPTPTPTPTDTPTPVPPTPTPTPTDTPTPVPPTPTPTPTDTPTPVPPTPTPTPTDTPTPIPPTPTPTDTPTPIPPTPTPTSTATPTPIPSPLIYVSSSSSGTAGSVPFSDEDILAFDPNNDTWSMYFDGSDVGVGSNDLEGFLLLNDGSILMAFEYAFNLSGVGYVDESDIIQFFPTSLGVNTAGSFDIFFDGSDVGLGGYRENIDAIGATADGRLVISMLGSFSVSGASGQDEDLLVFNASSFGSSTSGSFDLYFDGSDVSLTSHKEDIKGTWIDATTEEIYLTTLEDFSVPGVSGDRSDIFICAPGSLGSSTSCIFSTFWDGSANGFTGERTDGISIGEDTIIFVPGTGPTPTNTPAPPTNTPAPPTPTNTPAPPTPTNTPAPPTPTNTPAPPTNTPAPPTPTNTPAPPTPTNTPAPPTPTNTPAPPTNTPAPPTNTPVPPTPTSTPTGTPDIGIIYVSSSSSGSVGSVTFKDEDILAYDSTSGIWSMFFDGSDVGLGGEDLKDFYLMDDGSILMTFEAPFTLSGVGSVDDSDVVQFFPTSTGTSTSGSFILAFDGSDVGLSSSSEDIDAIGMAPDGRFVISTVGSFSASGVYGSDEDLFVFNVTSFGSSTSGSFELYFDGSDVGLASYSEDVNGTWIDTTTGEIYLTTKGSFSVPGASGDNSDIFICASGTLGDSTSCTFSFFWDGSASGFSGENIDGFSINN